MTLNRREFLDLSLSVAGTTAIAGCTSKLPAGDTHTGSNSIATVTVDGTQPIPNSVPVSFEVSVPRATVTKDDTALVRITVTNTGSEKQSITTGGFPFFSLPNRISKETDPGLILTSSYEKSVLTKRSSEAIPEDTPRKNGRPCWKLNGVPGNPFLLKKSVELDPGSSRHIDLQVWGHPQNSDCLHTGNYHFQESYSLYMYGSEEEFSSFSWGFTLRLTKS